ncbi:hypothetical protein DMO16_08085 [Fictibacillus sp. S7]|nr:hypothetical protein DMO16_08085 [Fictibacillus sp. S7]
MKSIQSPFLCIKTQVVVFLKFFSGFYFKNLLNIFRPSVTKFLFFLLIIFGKDFFGRNFYIGKKGERSTKKLVPFTGTSAE